MKGLSTILFLLYFSNASVYTQDVQMNEGDVKLYLYKRDTEEIELNRTTFDQIDPDKAVKFIIHGWVSNHEADWVASMTDAFLNKGDFNVIQVDWEPLAALDQPTSVAFIPLVGSYLGISIAQVQNDISASFQDIHIVGHSYGAQIAGFTGKFVEQLTNSKIGRITGLDPGNSGFEDTRDNDSGRLSLNDAELVDTIYTDSGIDSLGFPVGHINFYPNGGVRPQPGCINDDEEACSHKRATYLFIEELENSNGFLATKCDSLEHFEDELCAFEQQVAMGGDLTLSDAGDYYLRTNAEYPYSLE